ncbi:Alpha/Beta hydrolase protein [Boeremia exigua]|uniref:Alpha/Beta hydrolase protein n=1 Tax=Boeremia exigua TaxID=749465 RepID=UPI001E8ECDCC|nr:Alpha/Beta hydrolase protein [Boeremia exigua]KAH6639270.1 Alpha/Beta hydrolase protein [Boeremia exigua]
MAHTIRTTAATRFDTFDVHQTSYKRIGNSEISVGILIPKDITQGKHALHVKFHGGGLISGDALLQDWFSNYLVSFTHRTSSIIVLPNYRFVPESSGADIIDDVKDFWSWADRDLADYIRSVAPGIDVDFDRLLLSGDSSGCWCALHSVFELPEGRIKALLLLYPMVKKWCKSKEVLRKWGRPAPDEEVIDTHLAQVAKGDIVSGDKQLLREELADAFSANEHRWDLAFGTDKHLHPIERLDERSTFPPSVILHGDVDTSVKLKDCEDFVERVGETMGSAARENVHLIVREGKGHGFEIEMAESDEPWLAEQLSWIEGIWLH